MEVNEILNDEVESDVLVIGGGLAGCFAAIAARKNGLKVVLIEKADVRRSGDATFGIDHIVMRHENSEISPISPQQSARKMQSNPMADKRIPYEEIFAETYERILDLEKMGCKVRKSDGQFIRVQGVDPGIVLLMSVDQKVNLARELNRLGVLIFNRIMATGLLIQKGGVAGAVGLNTRDGNMTLFRSRSVVLATGKVTRLYPNSEAHLGGFIVQGSSPASCGDGHAMAFRAGAKMVNMEFSRYTLSLRNPLWWSSKGSVYHAKPEGYSDPLVNYQGASLSTMIPKISSASKYDPLMGGDPYRRAWEMLKEGEGPLFYDMTSWPEEAQKLMTLGNICERPLVARLLQESGIDYRTHRIEAISALKHRSLELGIAGVKVDGSGMSSIPGLFAAGDLAGGTFFACLAGAVTWGHRAGRFAADYAATRELLEINPQDLLREKSRVVQSLNKDYGISWQELEKTIQMLMNDYVGIGKTEWKIKRGLELLKEVREKLVPELKSANYHELMRGLEIKNILDVAEVHALSSLTRNESRMGGTRHIRVDYPEPDDVHWKGKTVEIQKEKDTANVRILSANAI